MPGGAQELLRRFVKLIVWWARPRAPGSPKALQTRTQQLQPQMQKQT